jgi:hypothetical protein
MQYEWEDLAHYFEFSITDLMGFTQTVVAFMSIQKSTNGILPTFEYTPSSTDE